MDGPPGHDDLPPVDAYGEAGKVIELAKRYSKPAATLLDHAFWVYDAKVTETVPYVIKGVLSRGQLIVVWGAPGSGKSFVTTEMLCAVGSDQRWHGRRVQKGPCIYVVAESNRVNIENRIAALRLERPDLAEAEVLVIPVAVNLLTGGDADRVIEAAKAVAEQYGAVALIAVDTLAVTFGGGDENSSQDMGMYVDNIKRIITETGACVLVVHHSGKNELMRGSSALLGALDGELFVEGKPGDGERTLKSGKIRDGAAGIDLFSFKLRRVEIGTDQDGDPIDTCVVEPLDEVEARQLKDRKSRKAMGQNQKAVLSVLERNGRRLARIDLANKLKDEQGMARQRVNEAIGALLDSGMLVADNTTSPESIYIP